MRDKQITGIGAHMTSRTSGSRFGLSNNVSQSISHSFILWLGLSWPGFFLFATKSILIATKRLN